MEIGTHEIIEIMEEIKIDEIVRMEGPIIEMTDEIIEAGETIMIKIEAEAIVETIMVETEDPVQHIATDHGAHEVLQEDGMIVVMIGADMIDIEGDLVKAREERKKDIITRIIIRRMTNQNSNLHGNGWLLTKKET